MVSEYQINFRSAEYEKLAKRVLELSDSVKDKKPATSRSTSHSSKVTTQWSSDKSFHDQILQHSVYHTSTIYIIYYLLCKFGLVYILFILTFHNFRSNVLTVVYGNNNFSYPPFLNRQRFGRRINECKPMKGEFFNRI